MQTSLKSLLASVVHSDALSLNHRNTLVYANMHGDGNTDASEKFIDKQLNT